MSEKAKSGKRFNIIVSCLVAILLWFYVVNVENPTGETTLIDIPVTIQGAETLSERGLMVTDLSRDDMNIKVSGKRKSFLKLYQSGITVRLDVSGITEAGEYQITGKVYPETIRSEYAVSLSERHNYVVQVTVKAETSREIPLRAEFTGTLHEGYEADAIQLEREAITVTGPEDVIARIAYGLVQLHGEGMQGTLERVFPVVLMDAQNKEITEKSLILSADSVNAVMPVVKVFKVPLTVELLDGGGATAKDAAVTITPSILTIAGDEEALKKLDKISLGKIDLSQVFTHKSETMEILLPPGIQNRSGVTEASVNVKIESLPMKSLMTWQVEIINIPAGYDAALMGDAVQVWVRGTEAQLSKVQPENLRVLVDLSGITPMNGQQRAGATVVLEGVPGVGVVGTDYSVAVKLTRS